MTITYGNISKAYKLSKGRTTIDVDDELKKLLQKEITNSIKEILKNNFDYKAEPNTSKNCYPESFMPQGGCSTNKQNQFDIDQMVASALINGTQTTNILRGLFGLVPSLIGR